MLVADAVRALKSSSTDSFCGVGFHAATVAVASPVTWARLTFASIAFPLIHARACSVTAETVPVAIVKLCARKFRTSTSEPWCGAVLALAQEVVTVTVSTASLGTCKERLVTEFTAESRLAYAVACDAFAAIEALAAAHLLGAIVLDPTCLAVAGTVKAFTVATAIVEAAADLVLARIAVESVVA